jgi:hypothetical protein
MDRLGRLQKIPPIARRLLGFVLSLVLIRIGVACFHHGYAEWAGRIYMVAVVGLIWSTGFWYVLKRLFVVFIWYLRIFH